MRLFLCALSLSAVAAAATISGSGEHNPVKHRPAGAQQSTSQRFIVKLRAVSTATAGTAHAQSVSAQDRVASLTARVGVALRESRAITEGGMHVLQVDSAESMDATLSRLRADSDVEYAEPDQRRYAHAVPNDTLYPRVDASHPGQWYMQQPANIGTPSAVNAETAWDKTTGDSFVIADLDTGVRYDHPDLQGRLLPGYCFISDSFVNNGGTCLAATVSNAGASDPGDWVTSSDLSKSECSGVSSTSSSSWHGTRTAGILGAVTNNSAGIAGMTWQGQILPLRVLGKCGGQDSDILSAILWAAGITVAGTPANPTPARIINMSLGGSGTCPSSYQDAIRQVTAKGVLVVVSAGNENGPVDVPGNCPGVAAVAGLRHTGTKVGYSSFGKEVAISAPAGNCVNSTLTTATPCVYPITSTTNPGSTTPSTTYTSTNAYTDQVNDPNLGTSFSAPIVSGIAALMASVNSNLSSCQLISRLQEGSTTFPTTSAGATTQPPSCPQTDASSQECICNTQNCGAGMANAAGAVNAALRPIAAVSLPATVSAGEQVTVSATGSAAATGRTVNTYQWTSVGNQTLTLADTSTDTVTVTAPACGYGTVRLTVSDSAGQTDTADIVFSPTSATSTAPSDATIPACSTTTPQVLVAICPATARVGTSTQLSLSASVANTSNSSVTWAVNGIANGNSTVGTISSNGTYTAPATIPSPASVTVTATSSADSTVSASATLTVVIPVTLSISPTSASVQVGQGQTFTATVGGTSNTAVTWQVNGVAGGNSTVGTISSAGAYTAPGSVPSPATVTISAVTAADATVSASASVTVTPAPKSGGGAFEWVTLVLLGISLGISLTAHRRQHRTRLHSRG